jgi:hypothetical protein
MDHRIILKRSWMAGAALLFPLTAGAQSDKLVSIRNLTPHEYTSEGFVLTAGQDVTIRAVGAEPAPERRRREKDWWGPEDERDVWPAAAWIVNARTREVVWDLRTARTERTDDGLHHFAGPVRLPAGVYEAHYASYPAAWMSRTGRSFQSVMRELTGGGGAERYGGPYIDDGLFREFELMISGKGHRASTRELEDAFRAFTATAIARVAPEGPDSMEQYAFSMSRPTEVTVTALGEVRRDGAFDYAWIMNADTRERVWAMTYENSEEAGGAHKNRREHTSLRLPAGRYVAYYVTDDTHHPGEWNAVPPLDPWQWGLTLRIADAAARGAVRTFVYEPVPSGQTIVSLTGIGDDETRSEGFSLKQPLLVRIYALGEGTGGEQMHDYAWIVDANSRRRVWTMTYAETHHAGGAEKNRLYEGTLRLEPGSYLVYYRSDGSHSAKEWNASRPTEARYWGVSVFPASGRLDRSLIGPVKRAGSGTVLAELPRMGDNERARTSFRLDKETTVRVYALGEGSGGDMYDYAWIEVANSGRVVWEMTYRDSQHAGGADKNRVFDGTVRLPAGSYVLRYESDGSHSYEDWNSDPPDDPDAWGVMVRVPEAR